MRAVIVLPWRIARGVISLGAGLLPGSGDPETVPSGDVAAEAAAEALERDREPREEAIFTPDDDFFDDDEHVETEVEVVAQSADAETAEAESPGPQLHVDEPWEGYRRMNVAEIVARLEGQPPEVLSVVKLYETTHRRRAGVLNAIETASRA